MTSNDGSSSVKSEVGLSRTRSFPNVISSLLFNHRTWSSMDTEHVPLPPNPMLTTDNDQSSSTALSISGLLGSRLEQGSFNWVDPEANFSIGRSTWIPGWLAHWLADVLAEWLADWVADWLIDWLIDWLADLMTGWLVDWLNDWLTYWMHKWLNVSYWLRDWLTAWTANGLTDYKYWLNEWLTALLSGRVTIWMTDWLIEWQT